MKRISFDTVSTNIDFPNRPKSSTRKYSFNQETHIHAKETVINNQEKTDKPSLFKFSHYLFDECFPFGENEIRQNKKFHKLRHHSLDKQICQKQQHLYMEKKTSSLNDSFMSFGRQTISHDNHSQITKSVNQCFITDLIGSWKLQKYNVSDRVQKQQINSVLASPINSGNINYSKYINSLSSKLFLSQDVKLLNRNLQNNYKKDQQKKLQTNQDITLESNRYLKSQSQNQQVYNSKRLSTLDSYKMKQNLQTQKSQTTKCLEFASILCQSIQVNKNSLTNNQNRNQQFFEFDHMKDSLIDKLNQFKKQQSFIDLKRKNFIRSSRFQKKLQQTSRFCNDNKHKTVNNHQNEQEYNNQCKLQSIQAIEPKIIRNRFKTLDQCGYTIVSKYNKSLDQRSILQESNIVFQASKMYEQCNQQENKLVTFSDSQLIFDQTKVNNQNQKQYNSFIHEFNLDNKSDIKMGNSNDNLHAKKLKSNFLRSNKTSSQKQIRSIQKDQLQIRFDLDTFIQYGPL